MSRAGIDWRTLGRLYATRTVADVAEQLDLSVQDLYVALGAFRIKLRGVGTLPDGNPASVPVYPKAPSQSANKRPPSSDERQSRIGLLLRRQVLRERREAWRVGKVRLVEAMARIDARLADAPAQRLQEERLRIRGEWVRADAAIRELDRHLADIDQALGPLTPDP